jgi:tetratricopeptide (TPR) repeat protein
MQLQISHIDNQNGLPQFEVVRLSDGKRSKPVPLVSPKNIQVQGHGEKKLLKELRWYLEKYLEMPIGAYSELAEDIQKTLNNWGRECFTTLFTEYARDWYQEARRNGLENLRLKISSNTPEILAWPWEALYSDDDGYIALRCCIERQISEIGDPLPLSDELKQERIHILYIISRPQGNNDIGYQTLARPLIDYIHDKKLPVFIDILRPPTFEQLRDVLHKKPNFYHIVHFDGHGRYTEKQNYNSSYTFNSRQGSLAFEDKNGDEAPVEAEKLSHLLAEYRIPIVVLNACQSAMIDDDAKDAFVSVAASLLKAGVRSVVAMSYSLYVSGAKVFVPDFYRCLFETGNVAEAMRMGRQSMYNNKSRLCIFGEHALSDWLVPVLYQQLPANENVILPLNPNIEKEKTELLPDEVQKTGDYRFIGFEKNILALERAILKQDQAGLLIYGMAGIGKTTLAKGFLHWLRDTNGLEQRVFWFDFRDIRNTEYIVNILAVSIFGETVFTQPETEKIRMLLKELQGNNYFIVWDNFESTSGIEETEKTKLKNLLGELRRGKTKILITSRSPESWLTKQECYPIPLTGMHGEEIWEYSNAIVKDIGLKIQHNNEDFINLINKLDGNPLALRAILLRLGERTAGQLLVELNDEFKGCEGDESTSRIQAIFNVFERDMDKNFTPVLQLIGLHEHYVDAYSLKMMLDDTEYNETYKYIKECLTILEKSGFCHHFNDDIYQLHPALRSCLTRKYPASEILQRRFVFVMWLFADMFSHKGLLEQRAYFMLQETNSYKAMEMAHVLCMRSEDINITHILAVFALDTNNYKTAMALFNLLLSKAQKYSDPVIESIAYQHLSIVARKQRDLKTAESWILKALDISLEQEDYNGAARCYYQLSTIAHEQGDLEAMKSWCLKSLDISVKYGYEEGISKSCHQLGIIAYEQGDSEMVKSLFLKSLETELKQGDENNVAIGYFGLGVNAQNQGNIKEAKSWYQKALEIFLRRQDKIGAARVYHHLGIIAQIQKNNKTAKPLYIKALENFLGKEDEYDVADIFRNLGVIEQEEKDFKTAESWYKKALEIELKHGDVSRIVLNYESLSIVTYEQGDLNASKSWCFKIREILLEEKNEHQIAVLNLLLSNIAKDQGDLEEAKSLLQTSLDTFIKYNDEYHADAVRLALRIL